MAEKIDISRLGVDEHKLRSTEIAFLRTDSPIVQMINSKIVEGVNEKIRVIKEESGNYRPFLIVENEELHVNVAHYLTTSIKLDRMEIDNQIRGEHLFQMPKSFTNYIASSAVKGMFTGVKQSLVDRDRFLFVTEDSLVDMESRATDVSDLKISLTQHTANAGKVDDILTKDLRSKNVTEVVSSGEPQLWTFKRTEGQPIIYNPTAMYISLFINAVVSFKNPKQSLTPKSLAQMAEVGSEAIFAYDSYLEYNKAIHELERQSPLVYNAYQNIRYYQNMITPASFEAMEQNAKKVTILGYKYRHIYGDAKEYAPLSLEDRMEIELARQGVSLDEIESFGYKDKIRSLLGTEKSLSGIMSASARNIITFLNNVSSEEKFNLSFFNYDQKFWQAFYEKVDEPYYTEKLQEDLRQKYIHLATVYKKHEEERRAQAKKAKSAQKQKLEEEARIRDAIEARIKKLVDIIENKYMPLYSRAFNQYNDGKLLPLTLDEINKFKNLTQTVGKLTPSGELGAELVDKLSHDLMVFATMAPSIDSSLNLALTAEKRIQELEATENGQLLIELMYAVTTAEQKITKNNKGLTAKEKKALIHKAVEETLSQMAESEVLMELIDPDFDFGRSAEELLMSMQDIYNTRSSLNALSSLKQRKLDVVEAIAKLNAQEMIEDFVKGKEAVGELSRAGVSIPVAVSTQSYEEIKEEFNTLAKSIQTANLKPAEYKALIELIQAKTTQMKKFGEFSAKLLEARDQFYLELDRYDVQMEPLLPLAKKRMRKIVAESVDFMEELLNDPMHQGIQQENGKWYVREDGVTLKNLTKKEVEAKVNAYAEMCEACLHPEVYLNFNEDLELVEQLYKKIFPTTDELTKYIRASVAQSPSLEDAIKRYNTAKDYIASLLNDRQEFLDIVGSEYREIVRCSQDMLESYSLWRKGFIMMARSYQNAHSPSESGMKTRDAETVMEAVERAAQNMMKETYYDYEKFKQAMQERAQVIISGLPLRTTTSGDLNPYLSKSTAKNFTYAGKVQMPKSVLGDNGIVATMVQLATAKREHCDLLEVFGRAPYSMREADIRKIEGMSIIPLQTRTEEELILLQKESLVKEKANILETIRLYALQNPAQKDFVIKKEGLEKTVSTVLKRGGEVQVGAIFSRNNEKKVEGVDYINFFATIKRNLGLIRERVENDTPFEGGEKDEKFLDGIETMYKQYASAGSASRLIDLIAEALK